MLKREFKINFRSFLIWTIICIALFSIAFIVYPSIMDTDKSDMLNDMVKAFPEEMLKMFNMDISGIDNVYGWFKTEGYTFLILIMGLFSSMLGINILLKEESDKTIEFLHSKPITRNKIVTSKIICGVTYILAMVLVVTIFNYFGMLISDELKQEEFLKISFAPLLACLPLFFISLGISSFFNKTRKVTALGIGIVFIGYFMQIISALGDTTKAFKYFSVNTLSDARKIIIDGSIGFERILITLAICVIMASVTYIRYNKKELV